MFRFPWRNGFASGLIVGTILLILLCLIAGLSPAEIEPVSGGNACAASSGNDCSNNSESMPELWYWLRRLFSFEDTIAQWIMTIFTIAAAGLLLLTLRATQNMVRDTREIGEAQTRAYLSFDRVEAIFINSGDGFTGVYIRPRIKNTGQTPADICLTHSLIYISEDRPSEITSVGINTKSTMRVGSQNNVFLSGGTVRWDDLKIAIERDYFVILVCGIDFEDVFFKQGQDRRTEDFAVRVVFNGCLNDPKSNIEEQPLCEWRDLQLDVVRPKTQDG